MPYKRVLLSLFLLASTAAFATASPAQTAQSAPMLQTQNTPGILPQTSGTYAFRVGDALVTALSDGTVPQDLHALLSGTTNKHTDALLTKNFQVNPVEVSLNAFLLRIDGKTILVDTGSGQLFGPNYGGKLLRSLAEAGVTPDQVTDILLTHLHDDHMGGIVHDGHIVFTNAIVHVGKPDIDSSLIEPMRRRRTTK